MKIVTNGDFVFPLHWLTYFREQVYMWSYSTGTPNVDETIRFFTHLPMLFAFMISGSNAVASYTYILLTTLVSFASFYYFLRHFFGVKERSTLIIISLFYALNPVFLGNYSKIGLVLATNMLPLLLAYLKQYAQTKRFVFAVYMLFALNISFIHPFNFAVNFAIFGTYFAYIALTHKGWLRGSVRDILKAGLIGLALNAVIVCSVIGVGTLNKSALSTNIGDQSDTSANLVDIANTGNLFTAFTLSKNIFLDFNFFENQYPALYYTCAYLVFLLLVGLYCYVHKHLNRRQKILATALLVSLLVLLLLSTGTAMGVDRVINFFISLPGGWSFRSPLKWQFYIPVVVSMLFALLIMVVHRKVARWGVLAGLLLLTIGLSGYITKDIVQKLIIPKDISQLTTLPDGVPQSGRVLLVRDENCTDYRVKDGSFFNELAAVYNSKSIQLKEVNAGYIDRINLSMYNQVLSCSTMPEVSKYGIYAEARRVPLTQGDMYTYNNKSPLPAVFAAHTIKIPSYTLKATGQKYAFVAGKLRAPFTFALKDQSVPSQYQLNDIFEDISPADIGNSQISKRIVVPSSGEKHTVYAKSDKPLFYQLVLSRQRLTIAAQNQPGFAALTDDGISLGNYSGELQISYVDPMYTYKNLVSNPSLESGLWQAKVGDCYNYDKQPDIAQSLVNDRSHGTKALQLDAARHIACTGPGSIPVEPGQQYLVGFDYKLLAADPRVVSRYTINFDNPEQTRVAKRVDASADWNRISETITAPEGARSMTIIFEAIPYRYTKTSMLYDNVFVSNLPPLSGNAFLFTEPNSSPRDATLQANRKNTVTATGSMLLSRPTNIILNDSYSRGWQLEVAGKVVPLHYAANGQENGWYVDPAQLCTRGVDCNEQISLRIYYGPQGWLVAGILISSASLITCVGYVVYERRRYRRGQKETQRG